MMGGRFPQAADDVGQTVASFPTYEAAQKAVSKLIAGEVPARDIAIVGKGLRSIERVTGRLGYAAAARSGAINGVLLGLLFSAILVIGTPSVPIQAFVGVLFVGIAIGMLLSLVTYSFVRRRRDYASVTQVLADHYEVTVTAGSFPRARQIVGSNGSVSSSAPAPANASRPEQPAPSPAPPVAAPPTPLPGRDEPLEPPRYGERVPPAGAPNSPIPDSPIPEGEPGEIEGGGIEGAPVDGLGTGTPTSPER